MKRFAFLVPFLAALAVCHGNPLPPGAVPEAPADAPQAPKTAPVVVAEAKAEKPLSIVRVNVTNQAWDFGKPWGKRSPFSRRAIGAVLANNRVLVTAELVANATFVEFETADGAHKVPAEVDVVDYECNLALLKTDDEEFLSAVEPVGITMAKVGDQIGVWQLENNGNLLVTNGPLTTVEVIDYPIDDSPLLAYKVTTQLQMRDSSYTIPAMKDGKLAGILQRYNNTSNEAQLIPAPIIEHFLQDAKQRPYKGFPRTGIGFSSTRDPQLRRFVGLKGGSGGVYVTDVLPGGPAEKGGVQEGDVILRIDGLAIDQDGNFNDPDYGKIAIAHLLNTHHFDGDAVKFTVLRKGETKDLTVTVSHRPATDYVSEPYVLDRAPSFYIVGGLILQELSRQYLKEWGPEWQKKAPEQFVYLDRYQAELFKNGPKKIVFLSRSLPSEATIGYEEVNTLIVEKINGVALQSLADVPAALAKAENGMHKIEFDGDPGTIYLDAAQAAAADAAIQAKYRLPSLKRLE